MIVGSIVDGHALVQLVWVGLVAALVLIVAFSFAILGAARASTERRQRRSGQAAVYGLLAVAGTLVCAAAVGLGVAAMLHKG